MVPKGLKVKFVRAAYNRSVIVGEEGEVLVWGQGFHKETIQQPKLLFKDGMGIEELKFGETHGLYI